MQPAFAINGFGGLFGHLVIALHDQEASATEFTAPSAKHYFACGRVDDLHRHMR